MATLPRTTPHPPCGLIPCPSDDIATDFSPGAFRRRASWRLQEGRNHSTALPSRAEGRPAAAARRAASLHTSGFRIDSGSA